MNKPVAFKASFLIYHATLLLMPLLSVNTYAIVNTPSLKNESDSIRKLYEKCTSDSSKYMLLYNIFWKNYYLDFNRAKYYGEWLYYDLSDSRNQWTQAWAFYTKGILLLQEDKFDSASIFFKACLKTGKSMNNEYQRDWSYERLGKAYYSLGYHDSAINYYKIAIRGFQKRKDTQSEYNATEDLVDAYIQSCQYDSAETIIKRRLELVKKMPKQDQIFTYTLVYYYYLDINNNKKTIAYLNYLLRVTEGDHELLQSIAFLNTARYLLRQKKTQQTAMDYLLEGLHKNPENIYIYQSLSDYYLSLGRNSMALYYALICLNKTTNRAEISLAYSALGRVYKKMGNINQAIYSFEKSYNIGYGFNMKTYYYVPLFEIADLYLKTKNYTEAYSYYKKTYDLALKYDAKKAIILSHQKFGDYYQVTNQLHQAEHHYKIALNKAKEIHDILLIKRVASDLNTYYLALNNMKAAYGYLVLSQIMGDSLSMIEREFGLADFDMRLKVEKIIKGNEAKQLLSAEETKRQKVYRNFLIVISLLLALLGTVLFLSYGKKKKDNWLLVAQRDEIIEKSHEIEAQLKEIINQKNKITFQKDEIERISKKLHEADQAKLLFFANISHELRTPLTLIVSPLARLLRGNVNGSAQKLYSVMLRNSRKLQELINQLLDISKSDKNELTIQLKLHDFNKQVRIFVAMFQSIAEEKNIEFIVKGMQENLIFCFDAERVEQIVSNLLSNAFKFTPLNGKIEITISRENYTAILKVRDTGIGIPSESLDKVFDRFYQTDATITRHFEGSGIGLAITKELVERHNGTISVESEAGKWTEFTVILPIVQTESCTEVEEYQAIKLVEEKPSGEIVAVKKETSKNKETVLLVEDNNDLRSYVSDSLSEEYNVLEASNGT